jgi:hypothetical protein
MEIDESIRSKRINYMNRNHPNFQIEGYSEDEYYANFEEDSNQMFQGYDTDYHEENNQVNPEFSNDASSQQLIVETQTQSGENSDQIEDLNFHQQAEGWLPT